MFGSLPLLSHSTSHFCLFIGALIKGTQQLALLSHQYTRLQASWLGCYHLASCLTLILLHCVVCCGILFGWRTGDFKCFLSMLFEEKLQRTETHSYLDLKWCSKSVSSCVCARTPLTGTGSKAKLSVGYSFLISSQLNSSHLEGDS